MEIFPAIDVRAGRVVRMPRGDPSREKLYHPDPLAVADGYVAAGARWVHVVDLDRAFGFGDQTALVAALVKRLPIPVQVGGGLWTADQATAMRDCGVQRVVLGARAAASPDLLRELADLFSEDWLALAIDVKDGRAWSRDWVDASTLSPEALARRALAAGIRTVAYTDLSREGALSGADVEGAAALARAARVEVIVSGGVSSLADLVRVRDAGLAGAIIGRALFEGRFTLQEALACSSGS